ncbi:hypothetical protein [Coleofasciculus sp. FACHB-1120]|uniref:hypothetical protein n=1 Tax=Coleofasciculus sp. FACHB-1120 TaxID=2692783 RepID=UPI0016883E40|nr:hypothetical protein [Coleofasciculus sp. FACHB-1120]MBD2745015.1 hypothetical protein [Coleofasciculus sp. FACHB-1120]
MEFGITLVIATESEQLINSSIEGLIQSNHIDYFKRYLTEIRDSVGDRLTVFEGNIRKLSAQNRDVIFWKSYGHQLDDLQRCSESIIQRTVLLRASTRLAYEAAHILPVAVIVDEMAMIYNKSMLIGQPDVGQALQAEITIPYGSKFVGIASKYHSQLVPFLLEYLTQYTFIHNNLFS